MPLTPAGVYETYSVSVFSLSTTAASSGFNFPSSVVTLVAIDGGPTYYADNGFTYAVSAGYDSSVFPISLWLGDITGYTEVKTWADAGFNLTTGLNNFSGSGLSSVGLSFMGTNLSSNPTNVYVADACITLNSAIDIANTGPETVMIFLNDEPVAWNSTGNNSIPGGYSPDIVQTAKGTHDLSASLPTSYFVKRPIHVNMQHDIFDDYWFYTNNPALSGGTYFSTGLMTAAEMFFSSYADVDGHTRHTNLISLDYYWYTTPLDDRQGISIGGGTAYGLWSIGGLVSGGGNDLGGGTIQAATQTGLVVHPTNAGAGSSTFGANISSGAILTLNSGTAGVMVATVTSYTPGSPGSLTCDVYAITSTGASTSANNWYGFVTLSPDQAHRGCRYGDVVDALRPYQTNHFPAPLVSLVESGNPGPNSTSSGVGSWQLIQPLQMDAGVWSSIIHGARMILYFSNSGGTSTSTGSGTSNTFSTPYYQQTQAGQTISIWDRAKATNYLIQALTPVIMSPFAEGTPGYVTVTGDNLGGATLGSRAPFRPTTPNEVTAAKAYSPSTTICTITNFNADFASKFEVMAKFYGSTGQTINGVTISSNKFWLFSDYRGSGADTNITANYTIVNTGSTFVTRIYSDAVNSAAASSVAGRTKIGCGNTNQIGIGDTVTIANTAGVPGLNGSFTVQASNYTATTFDIPLTFGGALTFLYNQSGGGTIIAYHNIGLSSGTTFSDTFVSGADTHIYRVN